MYIDMLHAASKFNLTTERLDSSYGWLPWPDTLTSAPLTLLLDPCTPFNNTSLEGQVALALLPKEWPAKEHCSLAQIVRTAEARLLKLDEKLYDWWHMHACIGYHGVHSRHSR